MAARSASARRRDPCVGCCCGRGGPRSGGPVRRASAGGGKLAKRRSGHLPLALLVAILAQMAPGAAAAVADDGSMPPRMVRTRRLHWFGGGSLSSAPSALRKNRGGGHANDRPGPGRGDDKEGSGKAWRRAVGAALLLGAASTSLVAAVSLLKRRRAVGSTPKSFLTAVPSLFLAVASGLLLRAAATSTAQVGGGNALTVGIMVACGFLISLLMSRERSKSDLARDEAEETSTVADEEDCLSCDSCGLERDIFLPPSSVALGSNGGPSKGTIDMIEVDSESMSNDRRAFLFLHGFVLGAAATTSRSRDGTFAIVGIAALFHSVYLGAQDSPADNYAELAGSLLLSAFHAYLLSVGGALAVLAIPDTIANGLLAVAAGVDLQVALGMIVPGLKQRINPSCSADLEPSLHGETKQKMSHMSVRASRLSIRRFHQIQPLGEDDLPGYCVPCSETTPLQRKASSDSQPIPVTERPVEVDPEYTGLMKRYNAATWGMYTRIQEAREIRTRCGVCMESMEEGDAAVLTFTEELEKETGATDEESRRLLAICPSPLYTEPDAGECSNGAKAAKGGFLVAHKNCYETMEEPKCPQKKALREETVFRLDW